MSIYLGSELLGGTSTNTVSNAHSLLDYKWTDHKLNEMAWLRADTWSWQSGRVYEAAYNHLVADLSGAELKTETFNGITITYYVAKDGHKIAYESEITRVSDIFESLGTAWWYIIDIPNKRFKLPRCTHGDIIETYQNGPTWYRLYADGWCEQGGNFGAAFSSWIDKTVTLMVPYKDTFYYVGVHTGHTSNTDEPCVNTKTTTTFMCRPYNSTGNANWHTSGYAARNVSAESPSQYLYFYVGDYSVSAIEQTAGITSEELANKVDNNLENTIYSKLDFVIDYKAPTSADPTWYRLYKSGWVEQGGITTYMSWTGNGADTTITLPIPMTDTNYERTATMLDSTTNWNTPGCAIRSISTTTIRVSIATLGNNQGNSRCSWEVKGFSAR